MPANSWYHKVDRFTFQFWDGAAPGTPQQSVETYARAGVAGSGLRVLGVRGQQFEATLTEHFPTFAIARPQVLAYQSLVGLDPVEVWWQRIRLRQTQRTKYAVLAVQELDCQTHVRLIGPRYNYAGGVALVTRWTLLPIAV